MPAQSGKNSSYGSGSTYTFRSTPTGSGNWNTGGQVTGYGNIGGGSGSHGITPYSGNVMAGIVRPASAPVAPVAVAPVPVKPSPVKARNSVAPAKVGIADLLRGQYSQYRTPPNKYTNINQPLQPTRPVYTPQPYTNQTRPWNPQQPTYTPSYKQKDQSRIAPTFTKDQSRLPQESEGNRSFRIRHNSGGGLGGGGGSGW